MCKLSRITRRSFTKIKQISKGYLYEVFHEVFFHRNYSTSSVLRRCPRILRLLRIEKPCNDGMIGLLLFAMSRDISFFGQRSSIFPFLYFGNSLCLCLKTNQLRSPGVKHHY